MDGLIKWYNNNKGFGFIVGKDNKDYFFHVSKGSDVGLDLRPDEKVEFEILKTSKGLQADNVRGAM